MKSFEQPRRHDGHEMDCRRGGRDCRGSYSSRRRSIVNVAAVLLLFGAAVTAEAQGQPAGSPRPNVVLIITDDVGYGDFGSYGAPDIKTPNVDRLAREGVKLTDFYAAPTCTPTRASLITGRYQQRVALEEALPSAGARDRGLLPTGR